MSDLDRFELFTCVAQAKSLSQAATQLGMSKASLSKQIKQLESALKVDLFSRSGYKLTLTIYGETLLKQALRLKHELDETRSICQQFHNEPEGLLRVIVFTHFAKKMIFPRLKPFLQRYPKLRLIIDTSERIPDFEHEQADLAIGFSLPAPNSEEIIQRSMGTTYYVLCASPAYFAEYGFPKTLEDLHQHNYIGHNCRDQVDIKLQPGFTLSIQPYFLVNSVASMIECAKEGLGLVQLPIYKVEELLQEKKLIAVLSEYQRTNEHIYYYYPKYRYVRPSIQKFIDFFIKEIE
ncbi:MAG: LysR family transcriptional regulator [Pseudomonadota bacterium]